MLTLGELVRVARDRETVELSADSVERMRAHRAVIERASQEGTPAYGVTTGVGMRRGAPVETSEARAFNRSAILGHLVGLGSPVGDEIVRAALLRHANALAAGYQGVRPEIDERSVRVAPSLLE
jgi:histidine ammonia-lyase